MKKKLVTILTLALVLLPVQTTNAYFTDVSMAHSNSDAINYVQSEGIVNGYSDGTFKPEQTINRAEFTKIIIGSKYSTTEINTCTPNQTFSDIDPFEVPWIYQYTCMARNEGIINGYSDNTFRPYQNISFIEAAKIIANTFGYDIESNDIWPAMRNNEDEAWYKPFVEKLATEKAIPTSIDTFQKNITRGEMAEMVYRLKANVISKESKGYEELESGGWQSYSNETIGISFEYPKNYKLEEPTPNSDVIIIKEENKEEYLGIQIVDTTPPDLNIYKPNGADYIGSTKIDSRDAYKFYTDIPIGEAVLESYPFTAYVVVMEEKRWIQIEYYSKNLNFSRIIESIEFLDTEDLKIYFVRPLTDDMSGELTDFLVPVMIEITPETNTIDEKIKLTLQHLFSIKTFEQQGSELNNYLYLSNIEIGDVSTINSTTVINLEGQLGKWSIYDKFLNLQVEKTIEEYTENYIIKLNGSEKNWRCSFDLSGLCS